KNPSRLPDGSTAGPYPTTAIAIQGGTGSVTVSLAWGEMPAGLSLTGTPATGYSIAGAPQAAGRGFWTFVLKATDSANPVNVAYQFFTINVDPPAITTASPLPDGTQGQLYSQPLNATAASPVTWLLDPWTQFLPPGVGVSSTGLVSGTIGAKGS